MGNIYLASFTVRIDIPGTSEIPALPTPYKHAYLVYDADENLLTTNDQLIIRGGPTHDLGGLNFGTVIVESSEGSTTSFDGLDNTGDENSDGFLNNDKNYDGNADTIADRNYIFLSNSDALWADMVEFADTLKTNEFSYNPLDINSNSVANTVLNAVGLNMRALALPGTNDPDDFLGHLIILDSEDADIFTAYSYDDRLYKFYDDIGTDTIKIENGARLEIIKDSDAASGNTVVLHQSSVENLTVGVSYTLGVGSVPVYSDNFGVKADGNSFLGSLASTVLRVDDQYASGGRGVDVIEIRDSNNSLIKTINLAAVGKEDLGTLGLKLSDLFTAYTGHADVAGDNSADYIYGDAAANILRGERGDDVIRGGTGTDTYAFSFGDGNDTLVDDWAENDKIALDFAVTREMIDTLVSGSDLIVTIDGVGSLTIKDMAASAATFVTDHIDNVIYEATTAVPSTGAVQWGTEVFNPSTGMNELQDLNDTVTGDEFSNDHLEGRNGNDILSGLSGDDYLDGGFGSGDYFLVAVNDNALPARRRAAA